ncbi:hypothetical protein PROFUN_09781 [Planoprotostelium fungivorum]|uniref:Little elongation complex subunit 2 C-terminal domain-containing protein n=1 Tax=Planoprotostelium fungivorum TaxID=1890364 RepID=A0A2P6NGP2_9EUKA|nr:hypothetical protein PROFUN_09781 [Planoprotostelium fungivorum]
MSAASLFCQLSRQHQMCNFNKGMLHHSFSIAPSQSTKECALNVTCRQMSTAGNGQEQQDVRSIAPIRGTVKPQDPVLPPVVASPATQRQSKTTQNTPVVDVVHAAQAPNMAPSAVAQPPIIYTERELLQMRQGGNLYCVLRGIVRLEDLSDVDRQEIDRLGALLEAAASRKAKQGHKHKSCNKSHSLIFSVFEALLVFSSVTRLWSRRHLTSSKESQISDTTCWLNQNQNFFFYCGRNGIYGKQTIYLYGFIRVRCECPNRCAPFVITCAHNFFDPGKKDQMYAFHYLFSLNDGYLYLSLWLDNTELAPPVSPLTPPTLFSPPPASSDSLSRSAGFKRSRFSSIEEEPFFTEQQYEDCSMSSLRNRMTESIHRKIDPIYNIPAINLPPPSNDYHNTEYNQSTAPPPHTYTPTPNITHPSQMTTSATPPVNHPHPPSQETRPSNLRTQVTQEETSPTKTKPDKVPTIASPPPRPTTRLLKKPEQPKKVMETLDDDDLFNDNLMDEGGSSPPPSDADADAPFGRTKKGLPKKKPGPKGGRRSSTSIKISSSPSTSTPSSTPTSPPPSLPIKPARPEVTRITLRKKIDMMSPLDDVLDASETAKEGEMGEEEIQEEGDKQKRVIEMRKKPPSTTKVVMLTPPPRKKAEPPVKKQKTEGENQNLPLEQGELPQMEKKEAKKLSVSQSVPSSSILSLFPDPMLSAEEHSLYINLHNKFLHIQKHRGKMTEAELNAVMTPKEKEMYDYLNAYVTLEQRAWRESQTLRREGNRDYMAKLRYISPQVENQLEAFFQKKRALVFTYPQYYEMMSIIDLRNFTPAAGDPVLTHKQHVLQKGKHYPYQMSLKEIPRDRNYFEENQKAKVETTETSAESKETEAQSLWYKKIYPSVSEDPEVPSLVDHHQADFVLSSGVLSILIDPPSQFELPIKVETRKMGEENKKVILIDKPLVRKSMTNVEKNNLFYKVALEANGLQFNATPIDFDKKVEGKNQEEGNVYMDNVTYNMWQFDQFKLLIRCKIHGHLPDPKLPKKHRCIGLRAKMEYREEGQENFSEFSQKETANMWIYTFIRPDAHLMFSRVDPAVGSVLESDRLDMPSILHPNCGFSPEVGSKLLISILRHLHTIEEEGHYLLTRKNEETHNLILYKNVVQQQSQYEFDLHKSHRQGMVLQSDNLPISIPKWNPNLHPKEQIPNTRNINPLQPSQVSKLCFSFLHHKFCETINCGHIHANVAQLQVTNKQMQPPKTKRDAHLPRGKYCHQFAIHGFCHRLQCKHKHITMDMAENDGGYKNNATAHKQKETQQGPRIEPEDPPVFDAESMLAGQVEGDFRGQLEKKENKKEEKREEKKGTEKKGESSSSGSSSSSSSDSDSE